MMQDYASVLTPEFGDWLIANNLWDNWSSMDKYVLEFHCNFPDNTEETAQSCREGCAEIYAQFLLETGQTLTEVSK